MNAVKNFPVVNVKKTSSFMRNNGILFCHFLLKNEWNKKYILYKKI